MENYLLGRSEITHVTTSIGGTPSRYNLVRSIADPSLAYGELIVDYTSPEALTASFDGILQTYLNANYPDAYVRLKRYNLMYKKFPIEVEFSGADPAVLRDLTAQAAAIMEESPLASDGDKRLGAQGTGTHRRLQPARSPEYRPQPAGHRSLADERDRRHPDGNIL